MKPNIIKEKSFNFAVEIVNLYKDLVNSKKEYVMSRQLLKSGTSIGANVREAEFAQSRADFINKMSIALKEANEANYWIELLYETKFLNDEEFQKFKSKSQEILRLLVSIVKTSKD
ncbi:four helix bundle protein [Mangrovimonas cancribranchiae]|uniref:Four helix bundle protein n=1 Tax=Mangrovimonas cancribranchiae TaxID=3080055 RepID=A0AAU6P7L8_9FLAO